MFKIYGVNVLVIDGLISIAGKQDGSGYKKIKVGSILTDGERQYEVDGIPFVNYKTVEAMRENICVTIKDGGFSPNILEGKTLELVEPATK